MSKWLYEFSENKRKRLIADYGIPKSFVDKFGHRVCNDLEIIGERSIKRIIYDVNIKDDVVRAEKTLFVLQDLLTIFVISIKHYLEVANGEITSLLKEWREKEGIKL
jgi:hypothetical protein